jgi:serine/threonine protein phosphatase PrpC
MEHADRELRNTKTVEGPASCLASLLYLHDRCAYVAWVGDGPLLLIRDGRVESKTHPHSLVEELNAAGKVTPEQAASLPLRKIVTRALGAVENSTAETKGPWPLLAGDRFVLCDRRILYEIADEALAPLLAGRSRDVARALVAAARPGTGQLTAIVIDID